MGGEFVPLGCHSVYSLLWGTASVEALCRRAKEDGVSALALTDRNGLYGILPFWEAAQSAGLKPIVGAHLPDPPSPAFLLAADHQGYRRLARILTLYHHSHPQGSVDKGEDSHSLSFPRRRESPDYLKSLLPSGEKVRMRGRVGHPHPNPLPQGRENDGPGNREIAASPTAPRNVLPSGEYCERSEAISQLNGQMDSRRSLPPQLLSGDGNDVSLSPSGAGAGAGAGPDPRPLTPDPWHEALKEDRKGLVVLSPSLSFLDRLARASGTKGLYVALYPYGPQGARIRFSRKTRIPLAAVAPIYFLDRSDYPFHRLLRAIGLCTKLDRIPKEELAPRWAFFQSPREWTQRYLHCPEALRGMGEVAERCRMASPPWGQWVFPTFERLTEDQTFALLKEKSRAGVIRRYGAFSRPIEERLAYELEIIRSKGFASYFLVVEDIVGRFPITCGRGSAAASLVSYCLGITHVDPLGHNLFFERFLNPGRNEPPDIDVDFPWDERDAVLSYVLEKYGPERCAMVANHVGFRMRGAVREVAKVYGIPEKEIGEVSDDLSSLSDPWPSILGWAHRLAGIPRHLSVHCGGVVITPDPLPERVPVEQAPKGVPIIQWEKDITEAAGLVKIDLLGNRSLAVVRDTLASIQANYGIHLSYAQLNPLEDAKTQQLLAQGDTVGVFYVESPAMRQLLKKTGKGDFEHLVVQSSIIRPAANEYIREYVRRVRGGAYEPLHPLLAEILKETHGILCYQEDVSRVAMALAGFDAVQADELRKILSKKHKQARLPDYRDRFFQGALARGVAREVIEEVWRMILSFQGYSFCKPHSASYALVSFKACYLRAHFPAEFMAAVLSNQGGYYTTMAYLSEARRMGLAILPPDVNASTFAYNGYGCNLRVGLMQLKGVQQASLEALLEDRAQRGLFRSLEEMLQRVDMDPADLRVLIKAGCLDSVAHGRPRPELVWELLAWQAGRKGIRGQGSGVRGQTPRPHPKAKGKGVRHSRPRLTIAGAGSGGNPLAEEAVIPAQAGIPRLPVIPSPLWGEGQDEGSLFDTLTLPLSLKGEGMSAIPKVLPYRPEILLRHELETLGLLVSRHPLDIYRPWLSRLRTVPAAALTEYVGRRVCTVGWFVTGKTVLTRRAEPMEFVSFEDTTALYETTFFPQTYERFSRLLGYSRPYLLRGRVEEDCGAISLTVEEVALLDTKNLPDIENFV